VKRTAEDSLKTRCEIIEAAQEVFLRKGFARSTLEDVASEAGVTRGAVYHHFDSKAEILNALCEMRYAAFGEHLKKTQDEQSSPFDRLVESIVSYFSYLESNKKFADMQFLLTYKTELCDEIAGGMQTKIESMRALTDTYAELIGKVLKGVRQSQKLSKTELAHIIVCYQSGLSNLWLIDRKTISINKDLRRVVTNFVQHLIS